MEDRLTTLEKDVKLILVKHLPEINVEIAKLTTSMKVYGGLILAGITALIILGLSP